MFFLPHRSPMLPEHMHEWTDDDAFLGTLSYPVRQKWAKHIAPNTPSDQSKPSLRKNSRITTVVRDCLWFSESLLSQCVFRSDPLVSTFHVYIFTVRYDESSPLFELIFRLVPVDVLRASYIEHTHTHSLLCFSMSSGWSLKLQVTGEDGFRFWQA